MSPDTLRHYEKKGLLPPVLRTPGGYREYPAEAEARVRLVRGALALGFSLDEVARILAARGRGEAPCRAVRELAAHKLRLVEARIAELRQVRDRLCRVLEAWDSRLRDTRERGRAGLLESLTSLVEAGAAPPFLSPELRQGRRGQRGRRGCRLAPA